MLCQTLAFNPSPLFSRVSSLKKQQLLHAVPASQDLFEDEDLDESIGESSGTSGLWHGIVCPKSVSFAGAPTPKRIKQEKSALEKRFIGVMEATAQQLQAPQAEETAEELFGKSVGKKLASLKATNTLGVEWAMAEIQRIIYQAQCPAPPHQPAAVEQFNYVNGQGL
jgi:hypothetical protein